MSTTLSNPPAPAPQEARPHRITGRLVVGLAIVALGVTFLLDTLGILDASEIWHYWPAILVLIGVVKLVNGHSGRERMAGLIWLSVGALLLAYSFDLIGFSPWRVFWPALIILIGLSMVGRSLSGDRWRSGPTDDSGQTHAFAVMSGVVRRHSTSDYRGGEATAIMGGCEIDLRQCDITSGPAVLDVFALMGGIEIRVPGNWTIRNEGLALLGGIDDGRKETAGDPAKVLIIRGQAMMGGVELKN